MIENPPWVFRARIVAGEVNIVGELLGNPLEPTYSGEPVTAPPRVGDVTKPRELLGFEASVSLRDGLASVLEELREASLSGA